MLHRRDIEQAIRNFDWHGYRLWECAEALQERDDSCHQWVRDLTTEIVNAILVSRVRDAHE